MSRKPDSKTRRQIEEAKQELNRLPRQRAGCRGEPDCLRAIDDRIAELKAFIRQHER